MKTQNLFAALFVLTAIASTVFAQPPRGQEGRGPGGPPPSNPIVDAIDQNQDHEISASEIENASKNLLSLDKNNDGVLNEDELGHGGPQRSGRQGPPGQRGQRGQGPRGQERPSEGGFAAQLLEFDENNDGKLEKDELPERMQRMIEQHDTDGDGALDKEELEAMGGSEGEGRRGGGQRDGGNRQRRGGGEGGQRGGGGGDDSRAARFVERCMEFDANDDGLLSEEELTEMASNMPQRGGRGGEGGPRGGGGQRGGGGRSGGRPE